MKIKVSRGRTKTVDFQSERMDVGLEFDLPEITPQGDIDEVVDITVKQLERYLDSYIGD